MLSNQEIIRFIYFDVLNDKFFIDELGDLFNEKEFPEYISFAKKYSTNKFKMKKTLIITIGPPGAGKTTYAKRLTKRLNSMFGLRVSDCCADDYFMKDGKYNFDKNKLGQAHNYCKDTARKYMRSGVDCLVVHNTSTTKKERTPYHEMAKEWDYRVIEKRIGNTDEESIKLYAQRNIHSVPLESIRRMAERIKSSNK